MPARVLLGVTGGIAAYKSVELARLLQQAGHDVTVLQTRASLEFVGAATFAAITGRPVLTDEPAAGGTFPHLDAGRDADVLVIAPATAATLARLAHGQADDVLSATYLAFDGPVLMAPAMNVRMWKHPATIRNLHRLRADGVHVVEPEAGMLACGDVGEGRLAPVETIAQRVQQLLDSGEGDLSGCTIVVTAGGTREPIDSVRAITNRSSGRMGVELARAARSRGADVRLVVTSTVQPTLYADLRAVEVVERAADLAAALDRQVPGADALIMAAAVSDFTVVAGATAGKLERGTGVQLDLEPVADLLAGIAERRGAKGSPVLVGFAADPGAQGVERARAKLQRKSVDLIVHNDVGRSDIGFDSERNEVTILGAGTELHAGPAAKSDIAQAVLDAMLPLLSSTRTAHAST